MNIDFQAINNYLISSLRAIIIGWIPGGKFEGVQYVVRNPNRSDKHPGSFKINCNTGQWKDFSSGDAGGDPISLYAFVERLSQGDAAKKLSELYNINNYPVVSVAKNDTGMEYTPIIPIPENIPDPPKKYKNQEDKKYYPIKEYYPFLDKNGDLICYTCRVEYNEYTKKGKKKKEVLPLTYCDDGKGGKYWKFKSVPVPRPIYGLDDLEKYPNAQVLLVEGEPCRDYAKKNI